MIISDLMLLWQWLGYAVALAGGSVLIISLMIGLILVGALWYEGSGVGKPKD
jgi:hypothetical protein